MSAERPIRRDAFLYMDPAPPKEEFGQCGTCGAFIADKSRCYWHRAIDRIDEDDSCGLYVHGDAMKGATPTGAVTPEISGLYDGEVRCKHCRFSERGATRCGLYASLNERLSTVFALDTGIDPHGCCNGFEPLDEDGDEAKRGVGDETNAGADAMPRRWGASNAARWRSDEDGV
jgi:hypothetical protein